MFSSLSEHVLKSESILWYGWLKKLGKFSKRWRKRYFFLINLPNGKKELRYYDGARDPLLQVNAHPKGIIPLIDAIGVCYLGNSSRYPTPVYKKNRKDPTTTISGGWGADASDHKFVILFPTNVSLLSFQHGGEWESTSESQQGFAFIATISAFFPPVEVLHSGWMSKRRERFGNSRPKGIVYWKRHFFVYLQSGDLLYFPDEIMGLLQGRVNVRHAPTVKVAGEMKLSPTKETSLVEKGDDEGCYIKIAIPPSKMFVLRIWEAREGDESFESARIWLELLLQGHAKTKYTQLEQCVSHEKFEKSSELISAMRAGALEELRGSLWKGFSGALDSQNRQKRIGSTTMGDLHTPSFYQNLCSPIDPKIDSTLLQGRLMALALNNIKYHKKKKKSPVKSDDGDYKIYTSSIIADDHVKVRFSEEESTRDTSYTYTNDWGDQESGCRLLIALTRYQPYCHPILWKVTSLLLEYMDDDSAFWVLNSIIDFILPGYFQGYRPGLIIDCEVFEYIFKQKLPTVYSHLNSLGVSFQHIVTRWFLSLFTLSCLPLPTILRIWDIFFIKGLQVFYGVGLSIFLAAESKLYKCQTAEEVLEVMESAERNCIDVDSLFSRVFTSDLHLSGLSEDNLQRLRITHQRKLIDTTATMIEGMNIRLESLASIHDVCIDFSNGLELLNFSSTNDGTNCKNNINTELSFINLKRPIANVTKVANELEKNYRNRLARLLALKTQLSMCPLSMSTDDDLQSWLCQVRDGKISGAGEDSFDYHSNNGKLSVEDIIYESGLFVIGKRNTPYNNNPLNHNEQESNLSEILAQSLLTLGKTAFSLCLSLQAASLRYLWYSETWIPIKDLQEDQSLEKKSIRDQINDTSPRIKSILEMNDYTNYSIKEAKQNCIAYQNAVHYFRQNCNKMERRMRKFTSFENSNNNWGAFNRCRQIHKDFLSDMDCTMKELDGPVYLE